MSWQQSCGFGFVPRESEHHFLVVVPRSEMEPIHVYERFRWDSDSEQKLDLGEQKVLLSQYKWHKIKDALHREFNERLKQERITTGKWGTGQIPVDRLLGKEMVLLMWAIEDCDPSVIPQAIKNWLGLTKEERWWLFTMTNASTGSTHDKKGWRKAIRYALTENPVEESQQRSIFAQPFESRDTSEREGVK